MDKFPVEKVTSGRMLKFRLYQLLSGQLVTRREALAAGAAGATGIALDRFFMMAGQKSAEVTATNWPKPVVLNAQKFQKDFESLGKYIYLSPEKLGGGTQAVDFSTGKTLAWISYWNYGDSCPISHHLAAYPSPDPYKGFEFVNSTQGGSNVLIYGLPTTIQERGLLERWGQGNHIYRVQFDGQSMNLVEDVSATTGIGLGVHITVYPDAKGFSSADGQKDVAAFFTRAGENEKTAVQNAFRADWIGAHQDGPLEENWSKGGTLRIERLECAKETGKYQLEGAKGNKIDWEMVPMAEDLVEKGTLPGDNVRALSGLDAVVHHPGNRYSALIIRMLSSAVIVDRKTWDVVACLHMPEGSDDNLKVRKLHGGPDVWEIKFDDVKSVGHEAGFSPDGKTFTMMNNIKQNNMAVFDTSAADPREWKRKAFVKDPAWVGQYPSPFHMCFSMDGSKLFVSVLSPKPALSGCCVVDTKTWHIIQKFPDIGPDCQTMSVTYDGKYVFQIFSGFQRLSSGVFIFRQDTLEPVMFQPNFGGHHDCVVIPTKVEQLRNSRCTTL
jgi:thiocyanate desulfurase